jgi:septal ring factor EnvC (AmiA/AmiB activator)
MKRHSLFRLIIPGISLAILLGFIVSSARLGAQSRSELEKERRQKEREIRQTKEKIRTNSRKLNATEEDLRDLNTQITQRQEYIGTLQNQLHIFNSRIEQESDITAALDRDLDALRKDYASLMYFMYKNRGSYNTLSFIFSSSSFNEAWRRIKFIRFYTGFREKQMKLIQETDESISRKLADLRANRIEKELVITALNDEKGSLEQDKRDKDELSQRLKGEGKNLQRQLAEQKRIHDRLDKAIRDIIAKEVAEANRKSKTKKKTQEIAPALDAKLSSQFAGNRSKLPWPVERGAIFEHFGTHGDADNSTLTVVCNGVKIKTPQGANARCIFSGEVQSIVRIPHANLAVIVKHGNYFSVYVNLEEVYVHAGDKLDTKQSIGKVAVNNFSGESELELQIWQGNQKLDPERWILRR